MSNTRCEEHPDTDCGWHGFIEGESSVDIGNPKRVEVKRALPGDAKAQYTFYITDPNSRTVLYENYANHEAIAVIEP